MSGTKLSIIIPAKNEAISLATLLPALCRGFPQAEIIVVDDGSIDDTASVCARFPIRLLCHPYTMGNGAAIKSGARCATGDILVFMDGDGQHDPADIPKLLARLDEGYAMVVGARSANSQVSLHRKLANGFYNKFASRMTGFLILDLTSGFRVVRA